MADTSSFSVKTPAKKAPNVSSGWIIMVLSGLVAVVIFFAVTSQGGTHQEVLVAAKNIQPGQTVDASFFRVTSVSLTQANLSHLITVSQESSYFGSVAAGPIGSGDFVSKSDFVNGSKDGLRAMSIPIDKSHAVDGNLRVGDRVDVVDENGPSIIVSDIEVIGVDSSSTGSIGSTNSFNVTVAVNPDQASLIGGVVSKSKFDVIRSTGAAPIDNSATTTTSTTSTTAGP
jgi:Flp pilus assembly protein CpaB